MAKEPKEPKEPKTAVTPSMRSRIKEVAAECFIQPNEAFCAKVKEELLKIITPEFLEKIRAGLIRTKSETKAEAKPEPTPKPPKNPPAPAPAAPTDAP